MMRLFGDRYKNKRVLVTGHTGFKGSWLSLVLSKLGAQVCGYSHSIPTQPSHYGLLSFLHQNIVGDILDLKHLEKVFQDFAPEIVFHMAAQPIVRISYPNARETFETNVMGSVNLLEACRHQPSVQAIIVVTSDKCYENKETTRPYQEDDPMGGDDPYSASKGCVELVTSSYRKSFFGGPAHGGRKTFLASVRAGNVVGGGDWADDRLVPDLVRSVFDGRPVMIRNPQAVRSWHHVLDALSGYLLLGQNLIEGNDKVTQAWNFGPDPADVKKVQEITDQACFLWPKIRVELSKVPPLVHEAGLLILDSSKAHRELSWMPVWNTENAIVQTIGWYKDYYEKKLITSEDRWDVYIRDAERQGAVWTK